MLECSAGASKIMQQSKIPPGYIGVFWYESVLRAAFAGIRRLAGLHLLSLGKAFKGKEALLLPIIFECGYFHGKRGCLFVMNPTGLLAMHSKKQVDNGCTYQLEESQRFGV